MSGAAGIGKIARLAVLLTLMSLAPVSAMAAEPYKPIVVAPVNAAPVEADLKAFLADLLKAARGKDREALAGRLTKDFFWDRDLGGGHDAQAGAQKNFENALSLNEEDLSPEFKDIGWERLRELLAVRSFTASEEHPGSLCGPAAARPVDPKAAEKTAEHFDTVLEFDWVYVEEGPVTVHAGKDPSSPALADLSWQAVRITDWGEDSARSEGPPAPTDQVRVHLPSGKQGYIAYGRTVAFLSDRLCYGRDDKGAWRITGYVGGGD